MENTTTLNQSNFIKIPAIFLKKEGNEYLKEEAEWITIEIRINPFYVTSYYPVFFEEQQKPATSIYVNGVSFRIDMEVEQFDELIQNADRSMKLKENKNE